VAGGGIIDMQDLGDGRYQAVMANGSTPIFTGDAGRTAFERLRKDQSAMGPNAFATGPTGGESNVASDAPRAPVKGGYFDESYGKKPDPGFAAPPAQAPQSAPAQPQTGSLGYAGKGIDPATGKEVAGPAYQTPQGTMIYTGPGTKGSPGGITKLGKQTLSEREEADAAAAEMEKRQRFGEMQGAALATEQAAKEKAFADKQAAEAITQRQNAEREAAEADNYVLDLQARADKAMADHAASRMPEDSAAESFFQGLGASLGAFGASLGKTPNFAAEYINQLKQNKIRKWEAEVNIKGANANNLLARLKDATGDMKLAKAAASTALDRQAAAEAEQMRLGTKTESIANTWATLQNAAAANGIKSKQKQDEDARLAFMKEKMYNAPAVAGRAGGFVPATQATVENAQGMSVQLAKLKAEEAAAKAGGGSPVATERTDKISSMVSSIEAAGAVKGEIKAMGNADDPLDDPTEGVADRSLYAQEVERLNQATITMAKGMQKGQSDADAADAVRRSTGGGSGRDRFQAASAAEVEIARKLRNELSTLPPEQRKQFLRDMPPGVRSKVLAP
jgi:hypothetical protein